MTSIPSRTRPQELAERALELSRSEACVVIAEEATSANLRWANNTLTSNGMGRISQLTVIAVTGGATGIVSRQGIGVAELETMVAAADRAAAEGIQVEDRMPLVGPEGGPADPGDWDAPPAETSITALESLAGSLGEEFRRAESAGEVLFGFASHELRSTYLASSTGLRARHDQPTGHVELNAKSADFSRSAWAGVPTEDFSDVEVPSIASGLSRRLAWATRRIELPPARYPTILPPSAVADLMIYLYWSASAREAHDGRSVFSRPGGGTRVGERLSSTNLTLRSDPGEASMRCTPFVVAHTSSAATSVFDNGIPLSSTEWISAGVLRSLVQTRYTAALTGLPVTPYVDNLILEGLGASGNLEDLVAASSGRTLLLTCLWYIREVDPQTLLLTGLTRDGVFLVEAGEVVGAVNNFRFNESPVDLLRRISSLGATERTLPREWGDYFTRAAMPALRVEDFNMSSVSQAS